MSFQGIFWRFPSFASQFMKSVASFCHSSQSSIIFNLDSAILFSFHNCMWLATVGQWRLLANRQIKSYCLAHTRFYYNLFLLVMFCDGTWWHFGDINSRFRSPLGPSSAVLICLTLPELTGYRCIIKAWNYYQSSKMASMCVCPASFKLPWHEAVYPYNEDNSSGKYCGSWYS